MCLNELGRYPVMHYIITQIIKYYVRLNKGTNNVILNGAFETVIKDRQPWYQSVQYILKSIGMGNIFDNQLDHMSTKYVGAYVQQRLKDQYAQHVHSVLQTSNRAKYIPETQRQYGKKEYLNINDIKARQIITKLRIDHNVLKSSLIQKRKNNDTLCNCKTADETVSHFLLDCKTYVNERDKLLKELSTHLSSLKKMSNVGKLAILLDLDIYGLHKHVIIGNILHYIKIIYKKRCIT